MTLQGKSVRGRESLIWGIRERPSSGKVAPEGDGQESCVQEMTLVGMTAGRF
jgi:hypothetical protein